LLRQPLVGTPPEAPLRRPKAVEHPLALAVLTPIRVAVTAPVESASPIAVTHLPTTRAFEVAVTVAV